MTEEGKGILRSVMLLSAEEEERSFSEMAGRIRSVVSLDAGAAAAGHGSGRGEVHPDGLRDDTAEDGASGKTGSYFRVPRIIG